MFLKYLQPIEVIKQIANQILSVNFSKHCLQVLPRQVILQYSGASLPRGCFLVLMMSVRFIHTVACINPYFPF